ncbi:MAG TPA: RloB family protein [Gemmataceae bacterium]|nr:RloB family protein [Gemmataceae bacterium]
MKRRGRRSGGKKRRGGESVQRRSLHRPEEARVLIVCEGRETEPNYFWGLQRDVRPRFNVEIKRGKGGSRLAIVQKAIDELEKAANRGENFDEVWCVFDVEQAGQKDQVIQARTLAGQYGIQLALSNPSFEVWLLAHFVRTKKPFADAAAVSKVLNKHWQSEFGRDYDKNDDQLYARLASRTPSAIENARKVRTQDWDSSADIVECNSATDVYLLVVHLLGPAE